MRHILKKIAQGEGITVEFKESRTSVNKDVYETVCAFSNRLGGDIFLGIRDDGDIQRANGYSCFEKVSKSEAETVLGKSLLGPRLLCRYNRVGY